MIGVMVVFLFLSARGQKRQQKERESMLSAIKNGTPVVLNSGIYGEVTSVSEHTVKVRVAKDVVVKVDKAAIARTGNQEGPAPANGAKPA